jgi:ATP:ADP antiporter, AAA family
MSVSTDDGTELRPGLLDRSLRLFSDVRAGEGGTALLMLLNLFLLFIGYYVMKVVRDATIVAVGGASAKAYSSAGQAVALMAFIPLYSWFAGRVDRIRLIVGMMLFFVGTLELFALGFARDVSWIAVAFYIWLGIYNVATPAQFWSFANDLYRKDTGERLFPVIAIGATAGAPLGAKLTQMLFAADVGLFAMLQIAAGILLLTLMIFIIVHRRESRRPEQAQVAQAPIGAGQGFSLVFANPYLRLIALLLVLLNVVNTNGNFILDSAFDQAATAAAATSADPALSRKAMLGELYGEFYFYQNILAVLLQALLVSRILKLFGMGGVLLTLPLVAFGGYGLVAMGAGLAVIRAVKIAENATDYSVMNTGRQMVWLPTRREEKYKAKQAVDTFFVRVGDVLSAVLVAVGAAWLGGWRPSTFALLNLALVLAWLVVVFAVIRRHRRLSAEVAATAA